MNFTREIEELVYQEYIGIEPSDYQEKIRYYERNKREILQLPFNVSTEIRCECAIAYFEVGSYSTYLKMVDELIQLVISENIYKIKGKNIFEELLFRKAASSYNVVDYDKGEYVFSELIKIDASNDLYKKAFVKCSIDKLRYEGQFFRGLTVLLFIITAVIIAIELLTIRPFYDQYIYTFEVSRNISFSLAIMSMFFQELRIRFLANKRFSALTKNN